MLIVNIPDILAIKVVKSHIAPIKFIPKKTYYKSFIHKLLKIETTIPSHYINTDTNSIVDIDLQNYHLLSNIYIKDHLIITYKENSYTYYFDDEYQMNCKLDKIFDNNTKIKIV